MPWTWPAYVVAAGALGAVPKQVAWPAAVEMLPVLTAVAAAGLAADAPASVALAELAAALVNKRWALPGVDAWVRETAGSGAAAPFLPWVSRAGAGAGIGPARARALNAVSAWSLAFWCAQVTKAAAMCGASSTSQLLEAMVSVLDAAARSPADDGASRALDGFALLLRDDVVGLAKADGAAIHVRPARTLSQGGRTVADAEIRPPRTHRTAPTALVQAPDVCPAQGAAPAAHSNRRGRYVSLLTHAGPIRRSRPT